MNDMSRAAVRVACDVGGTFTDVCVLDQATGQMRVAKTPTTPDPIDGVLNGIKAGGVDLRDMVLFAHGTTLATNALITRNFPPAIMVTTKGFRDVIEIRRGTRDDLWDTYKEMAPPYIQRRNRLVVTERIDYRRHGHRAGERGGGARGRPHHQQARREDDRGLLRQRLRQSRERAAHARHPGGGGPRHVDLALQRNHARDPSSTNASRRRSPMRCSPRSPATT